MQVNAKKDAIMLLDDESKSVIKTNISGFSNYGIKFLNSLDAVNDELLKHSHNVIILEGFMMQPNCLSDLELFKELYDLTFYYLGSRRYFDLLSGIAHCFECTLGDLDYRTVQAALFNDLSQEVKESPCLFERVCLAENILANEEKYSDEVVKVTKDYLANANINSVLSRENRLLEKRIQELEQENTKIAQEKNTLLNGYKELIKESQSLNKSLQQYEDVITQDFYDKVRLRDYSNRPAVIYFKEYEDFLNLDEFLETLVSVLKLQDRKSVKVLRLFDSKTSRKILTVPSYYKILHNQYQVQDIIKSDFICKSGDYHKILDKLLLNDVGLDILIIVDSKPLNDTIISGTALYLNLCREEEHVSLFDLNVNNTFVNTGDTMSERYWGVYDTSGMDSHEKMVYLSSKPIMTNMLDLSRYFMQTL